MPGLVREQQRAADLHGRGARVRARRARPRACRCRRRRRRGRRAGRAAARRRRPQRRPPRRPRTAATGNRPSAADVAPAAPPLGGDQLQQRKQADRLDVGRVHPGSAVAARLAALRDQDIGARRHGRAGLFRARHGHPRLAGQVGERVRAAERVRHRRDRLAREQLELRVPGVVVPARLAQVRRSTSAYVAGSARGPGTNRFTPNGLSVSARVAAIRSASASALR